MFYTQYNKLRAIPEKNSGKRITEKAGYLSAQKRIENLLLAGRRLVASRAQAYDFEHEIDEDYEDPTRNPGYDMADAFQDQLGADMRLEASRAAQNQHKDVEKAAPESSTEKSPKEDVKL